jgi:hypothetical protein
MAALDFGMALAKGMLPTASAAQKDLINLAGGRNIFKSEDWWSKAVDKQIEEGFRKQESATVYRMPSGEYQMGVKTTTSAPSILAGHRPPSTVSYEAPAGAVVTGTKTNRSPGIIAGSFNYSTASTYDTKPTTAFLEDRKYFTSGELLDIERSAKRGAEQAKAETAKTKASRKRLARGTGGLVGKAITPDQTGLPSLGTGGLGITSSLLGTETKL